MTNVLVAVSLLLTPAPLTAPKEASWPTPVAKVSVVSATPSATFIVDQWGSFDTGNVETTTLANSVPTTSISTPQPPTAIPPPPMTPIEAGLNRLTELGATPYQLRVFGCLAWFESKNDPYAVSPTGDYGILQINRYYHAWRWAGRDIYDPVVNAEVAWDIYRGAGFRAWTTARFCGV